MFSLPQWHFGDDHACMLDALATLFLAGLFLGIARKQNGMALAATGVGGTAPVHAHHHAPRLTSFSATKIVRRPQGRGPP